MPRVRELKIKSVVNEVRPMLMQIHLPDGRVIWDYVDAPGTFIEFEPGQTISEDETISFTMNFREA